jgi:histidinol-phosphate aminotransferase
LTDLGYQPHVSGSNFVLFGGVDDPNAMFEALLADGVLIRDVGIPGHLRVSAGTTAETSAFLEAAARYTHGDGGKHGAGSKHSAGGTSAGEPTAAPVGL